MVTEYPIQEKNVLVGEEDYSNEDTDFLVVLVNSPFLEDSRILKAQILRHDKIGFAVEKEFRENEEMITKIQQRTTEVSTDFGTLHDCYVKRELLNKVMRTR